MIGPWSLLLKIQKVHTHTLDYSYGKGTILSGVALSHFPSDQDKVRQAKAWKLKFQYCSANEKPSKVTKHKQISEFCNKMMYLLT